MKLLAYVVNEGLRDVTREDALMLDTINIAFGHVEKDNTLEFGKPGNLECLETIRGWNPRIKFVLSVGGWGAGGFSIMSRTEEGRRRFAESCAAFCRDHALDGIDIDWEYPCSDSANIDCDPSDKRNFTLLLQALRDALGAEKTVSIAAGAGTYFVRDTEMDKVAAICDYVQLMTYDMRSGFCREAGHHTAPFASADGRKGFDSESVAELFVSAGVPKEKTVLGAAFYSRKWDGVPNTDHGLFQKAQTIGQYGPGYTRLKNEYINKNGFVRYWDDAAKAPFLYNGDSLISYDDPESIKAKCGLIKREGYLGLMYWEHGSDPSRDLLRAMYENR